MRVYEKGGGYGVEGNLSIGMKNAVLRDLMFVP